MTVLHLSLVIEFQFLRKSNRLISSIIRSGMITSFGGIQRTMEVLNSSEYHLARSGSQILFYITSKTLTYLSS